MNLRWVDWRVHFTITDVTDRVGAVPVDNATAGYVCDFNSSEGNKADLFVGIQQIEDPDVVLRDVSSSHVTVLCASLLIFGFNCAHYKLSVTSHSAVSDDDETLSPAYFVTVGRQISNNGAKIWCLDERHFLEKMWQLHVDGDDL